MWERLEISSRKIIPLTKDNSLSHWTFQILSHRPQGLHLPLNFAAPFQSADTLRKKKEYHHHQPSATSLALFHYLSIKKHPKLKLLIFHSPALHSPTTICMLNTLGNSSWSPDLYIWLYTIAYREWYMQLGQSGNLSAIANNKQCNRWDGLESSPISTYLLKYAGPLERSIPVSPFI